MKLTTSQFSIEGPKGQNDDACLSPREVDGTWWTAIADGVSSSRNGSLAARICLDIVAQSASRKPDMPRLFALCTEELASEATRNPEHGRISSTLTVMAVCNGKAHVGHVGDTRITHLRGGGVMTRTQDQTEVQKLLDEGAISPYQAKRYPRRNVLLSVMSAACPYKLFKNHFEVLAGDRILLTTDGFHSQILRREMVAISERCPTINDFTRKLEIVLRSRGIVDDASLVAIEIGTA